MAAECRNCHEPGGELIAPCHCTGSIKYVHRNCLNTWRAMSPNPDSFYICDVCKFRYRLKQNTIPASSKVCFILRCVRDFFAVLLGILALILLCGLVMWGIDSAADFTGTVWPEWTGTGKNIAFDLFVLGFLLLCFIIGIGSCCTCCFGKCCKGCCTCCDPHYHSTRYSHDTYPYRSSFDFYWYWWWWNPCPSPVGNVGGGNCNCCTGTSLNDCSGNDCGCSGGGGGGDDCGAALLVIALIIILVFVLIGFFVGMVLLGMVFVAIVGHHARVLKKKISTGEFVVIDLEKNPEKLEGEVVIEIPMASAPPIPNAPPPPPYAPGTQGIAMESYSTQKKQPYENDGTYVAGIDQSSNSINNLEKK